MGLLFFKVTRQIKYQTEKYCKYTHEYSYEEMLRNFFFYKYICP